MFRYLAVLGNTPQLSLAELESLLGKASVTCIASNLAMIELDGDQQAVGLQMILGGCFKICRLLNPLSSNTLLSQEEMISYLAQQPDKVTFAVTSLSSSVRAPSVSKIKSSLKKMGKSVRFLEGEDWGISSAILSHHPEYHDLFLVDLDKQPYLAKTVSVQAVDDWTRRDRDKPYISGQKGMLPPKLARMMVNLGIGAYQQTTITNSEPLLYDPFCGTGTVLMEAALRDCQVIGSDLDAEAVKGAKANLDWLSSETGIQFNSHVFQADVVQVKSTDLGQKVDLIVTEPFLGKANPLPNELENIFTGLEGLYLGAFKQWLQLLHKGSVIVIIFPFVEADEKGFDLLHLIDKLERFGYTLVLEPIKYGYQKAIVKRHILVFRYH